MRIVVAESTPDIQRCIAVLRELRSRVPEDQLLDGVRRQATDGYMLACVEDQGEVRAVAGYRAEENLAWGRFLYVDDLVTREVDRSKGYGGFLFDWLVGEARRRGCGEIHLDSGVQRFDAHRFYLAKGMSISSHHLSLKVPERP